MSKAKESVRTFADGSKANVLELTNVFGGLRDILSAVGVSLSIAGLVGFIRSTIDSAQQVTNFARQLRIGTDQLQALDAEAAKSGVDITSLRGHLERLNTSIGNATNGEREIQKAFVETGVSFDTFSGKARAPIEVLVDLAKGFATASDKTAYMAAASKIMGRNASELTPLLETLARVGIAGVVEEQTKLGQVASPEALANIDKGMTALGQAWHRVTIAAQDDIGTFFDAIEKAKEEMSSLGDTTIGKDLGDIAGFIDGLTGHIDTFTRALDNAKSMDDVTTAAHKMWEGMSADAAKATEGVTDLLNRSADGWGIIFDGLAKVSSTAWEKVQAGAEAGTAKVTEFAAGVGQAYPALDALGTKAGEIWSAIVTDIQGGIDAMLRFLGLQATSELDSNLRAINALAEKSDELQTKLARGGTQVGMFNFLPFTPEEIAAIKTEIENLNAAIDALMLRRDELQRGGPSGSSFSGGGSGGLVPINFRGMVLGGGVGTATLVGGGGSDGARPPYISPTPGGSHKERVSAVEALTRAFEEQALEAGVASLAIDDQALALEKMQAQYKLTNAVLIDYHADLRKTKDATDAEKKSTDDMVVALHRVERVSAIDNLTKSMEQQALEAETAAANTTDHGLALEKLQAQYKLTTSALADYTANMRATQDPTETEIANVDALATHLNELKVAAAATADQKEGLLGIASGLKDIGAGAAAAAGKFQSWKDFATDAIQTVFDLLLDQITRLSQLGGGGGSIFQDLANSIFGAASSGILAGAGGGKGYAGGGSFIVGGVGGTDSQRVSFKATPGELVSIGKNQGGSNVLVQVINQSGQASRTQESTGPDGQRIVRVMIGDAFGRDLRERGPASQALEATYGLRRSGT